MKQYTVKRALYLGAGARAEVGAPIELPDNEAAALLASGAIEEKASPAPAAKGEQKPAKKPKA